MNASERLTHAVKKKMELDAQKLETQKQVARATLTAWTENSSQKLLEDFALFVNQATLNLEKGEEPPQTDYFVLSFDQKGATRIEALLPEEVSEALCSKSEYPLSIDETRLEIMKTISKKFKGMEFDVQYEDYSEMPYWFKTAKIVLRPCRVFNPCPVIQKPL